MFLVRCKTCDREFVISDDRIGVSIRCFYCGNPMLVCPDGTVKAPAAAVAAGKNANDSTREFAPPRPDEDEAIILGEKDPPKLVSGSLPHRARRVEAIFVDCSTCGQRMQISSRDIGQAVQCESCKAVMKVELPTVQAAVGTTMEIDEDDPLEISTLAQSAREALPVTRGFARRRAALRGNVGEKLVVAFLAVLLLGGLGWLVHHFMRQGPSPLRPQPASKQPSAEPTTHAPAQPVVDTYSWVDSQHPVVWDSFLEATWGVSPSALPGLTPAEPPSQLFDTGSLKWYKPAESLKPVGGAKLRSVLYAFLEQGSALRLCEIRVQCQSTYDREELQARLVKQYGPPAAEESPFATVEWHGRTSAGRDVVIEIGGKVPSFNGSQFRAAIEGIR
ncbi:MAG: hypothetical protein JW849_09910 [Phycisphaerae bacterium]|nr:hypothetical protein [Phycisphaerae bacterium]